MHQSIPSTNIPPGRPPGKFFKVVQNPAPGQNFSAKARPPGQENTYPREYSFRDGKDQSNYEQTGLSWPSNAGSQQDCNV